MAFINFKVFSLKGRGKGDLSDVTPSEVELLSQYFESDDYLQAGDNISLLTNDANYISDAPDDGSQYVRRNEAWDKLTTYSAVNPVSTNTITAGFPLGSDWFNTVSGEKFYHKADGVWISYTSSVTPPIPGGDSPVMFADYATTTQLYVFYDNGINNDGIGAQLISGDNEILVIDGTTVALGDTILVKNQDRVPFSYPIIPLSYQNGVYEVTQLGSPYLPQPWILTRVDYADESDELFPSQVNVLKGNTNRDRFFLQKTENPVIGVSSINYEINYVPPTQVVISPVIHVDTATTEPLPDCIYEDEFEVLPGLYDYAPKTSYLTGVVNGSLGVINGVLMNPFTHLPNGRRILVKNQLDPIQNGDYEVIVKGGNSYPWKLRRVTTSYSHFNKNNRDWKINNKSSTLYGNRYYMDYHTPYSGPIGSTPITFSEIVAKGFQNLQEVTTNGNVTSDPITADSYGIKPIYTSSIVAQLGYTGNGTNAGGQLSLRSFSPGTGYWGIIQPSLLTDTRSYILPDESGTIALLSNIPSIDSTPTNGSSNAVSSDGVFDALVLKADLVAGKVPTSQLPSYVDDVIEGYYSAPAFYSDAGLTIPIDEETGKIYVDLLQNKSYRWSGSVYIQISNAISSIDELTDVTVSSPLNGQLLQYNITTNQWENKTITVGTGDMQTSTYDIDNDGIVDFAETVPVIVRNPSVSDILRKGTIIYLSGSTGYRPNAYKAQANAESTSSGTFGVVLSDIGTTSDGTVAMMGTIHTLDTRNAATGAPYPFTNDVLVDGDVLWLDPNNAGYVTKTKPQAPNHIVFIGVVARTHPSLGRIVYRITNGYELDELHNVFINGTLGDNHILYYDLTTLLWKTKTIAQVLGFTPQELLSSGVNIKTINGESILGSGDIVVTGGTTPDINIINATKLTLMYNT